MSPREGPSLLLALAATAVPAGSLPLSSTLAIAATDTGAAAASTIDLQALSVSVQYEARLQGESWSTVCDGGGECHFSIPNLAPGTYQVEVRAQLSLDNYAAVTTHRWVVDTCGEEQYASYDAGSGDQPPGWLKLSCIERSLLFLLQEPSPNLVINIFTPLKLLVDPK